MIQIDAIAQLLIEKGIVSEVEYYRKLQEVKKDYFEKQGKSV